MTTDDSSSSMTAADPKEEDASNDANGGGQSKSAASGTEDRSSNGEAEAAAAASGDATAAATAKKKDDPTQVATVREVFSFAKTTRVKVYIVLSFLTAAVSGCVLPGTCVGSLLGRVEHGFVPSTLTSLSSRLTMNLLPLSSLFGAGAAMAFYFSSAFESLGASATLDSFMAGVRKQAFAFMALGGIIFVTSTIQAVLIEMAAAEMTRELKNSWFRALLRQDLAFYDIRDVPGQASLITTNAIRFRKGVGRKLADAVQFFVGFVGSIAYGFIASWYDS